MMDPVSSVRYRRCDRQDIGDFWVTVNALTQVSEPLYDVAWLLVWRRARTYFRPWKCVRTTRRTSRFGSHPLGPECHFPAMRSTHHCQAPRHRDRHTIVAALLPADARRM